ncbi:MAG TPA: hypothetical protein VMH04_01340 [Candidatus Solibacter sp.]|nr:hypothetical protein [Candidatus Solibacter sp.]
MHRHILRQLVNEFAVWLQEAKMQLEITAVQMAEQCKEDPLRPAYLQTANEKKNLFSAIAAIHGLGASEATLSDAYRPQMEKFRELLHLGWGAVPKGEWTIIVKTKSGVTSRSHSGLTEQYA